MIANKIKIKKSNVCPCWDNPKLMSFTRVGDILDVDGLPYGFAGGPLYYVVKNHDGLRVAVYADELEVIHE